jgi:ketosteroid isomerase-like protein
MFMAAPRSSGGSEDEAMNAEQGQAGDEAAIRALLTERAAATRARDASRFVTSLDPSIVTFDLAPPLRRAGPELLDPSGFQAWLDTWDGEIGYEMAELTISIGGDIAYCHSLDHLTGTRTDGEQEDFWSAPQSACARPMTAGRSHTSTRRCRSTWTAPTGPRSTCARNGKAAPARQHGSRPCELRTRPGRGGCPVTLWHAQRPSAAAALNRLSLDALTWALMCAPSAIRTRDLLLRRQSLYPLSYRGRSVADRRKQAGQPHQA